MSDHDKSARELLDEIRGGHARDLAEGRVAPYDAGVAMWRAAMMGTGERATAGHHCHALWLLGGSLPDWVELKPAETAEADADMHRAAREWLAVADDEAAWRPFFDHWLYTERGYKRP